MVRAGVDQTPGLLARARQELLSPAMVVALLALAVALSGTAYAAVVVTSKQIKNNTVSSADLKNGGVLARDLRDGSVAGADLKDGSVRGADVADGSVGGADLADGSVGGADLADGSVGLDDLSPAVKSAISDTWHPAKPLLPGSTVTGSLYYRIDASSADQLLNQSVALPARAPQPMTGADFAADGSTTTVDDQASCVGTYAAPTAPPGQLCAYVNAAENYAALAIDVLEPGADRGFIVRGVTAGSGSTMADLSWAYTAP